MFRCDPKTHAEKGCFKYLVQFVRSLSDGDLEKFLRFLTGSDTIAVDCIDVEVVGTPASASRSLIAHLWKFPIYTIVTLNFDKSSLAYFQILIH